MKNIDPIHPQPATEPVPESGASQPTPPTPAPQPDVAPPTAAPRPAPALQPQPAAASDDMPQDLPFQSQQSTQATESTNAPAAQPTTESTAPNVPQGSDIYPTGSPRSTVHISQGSARMSAMPPISVFLLSSIMGIYGVYIAYTYLKAVLESSFSDTVFGSISFFNIFDDYAWLGLLVGLIEIVAILGSAFFVWKGSKLALGIITGYSVQLLSTIAFLMLIAVKNFDYLGFEQIAVLIAVNVALVAQVICWTKDREYFD